MHKGVQSGGTMIGCLSDVIKTENFENERRAGRRTTPPSHPPPWGTQSRASADTIHGSIVSSLICGAH
jgi:hypothetical protein